MNTIFIDVESFAGEKPDISELKVPGNITKPESIEKWLKDPENLEEAWKRQALDVLQCQVVCIGYAINDGEVKTICGSDEKAIVTQFYSEVSKLAVIPITHDYDLKWVAHNGLSFDYPILWHRLKKYGLTDVMPNREAKGQLLDTMRISGYSDYKAMLSLKKLAKFYGLGDKSAKGSDVHDMYLAGKFEEIAKYCAGDVELLRKLFKILK